MMDMRRKRAHRPNATQETFWKQKTDEAKSKKVNSISHRSNVTLIFRFTVIRYCYLNTGKTSFSPQYVGLGFARRRLTIVLNCRPDDKKLKKQQRVSYHSRGIMVANGTCEPAINVWQRFTASNFNPYLRNQTTAQNYWIHFSSTSLSLLLLSVLFLMYQSSIVC